MKKKEYEVFKYINFCARKINASNKKNESKQIG